MSLSLRNTAYALDDTSGSWSLKKSANIPISPSALPDNGTISVRKLATRFSGAGGALRALRSGRNIWAHMSRATIVKELRDRLRDPLIMCQNPTGLCGPFAIMVELARRRPHRYVLAAKELLEHGRLTCPNGRVIYAEEELRQEPVAAGPIGQVDWLIAASMRDDANIWEDVDDDANGIESMTFWDEQRSWIRDVLDLPNGGWETCFSWGEIDCMRKAQNAVNAGGVACFLIDVNLLINGHSDREENMWWRKSAHIARKKPSGYGNKVHSKDDDIPPDHWVIYLGGFNLGSDPDDDDPIEIKLWSWGQVYKVTGTVDAFAEYLYAVTTGRN